MKRKISLEQDISPQTIAGAIPELLHEQTAKQFAYRRGLEVVEAFLAEKYGAFLATLQKVEISSNAASYFPDQTLRLSLQQPLYEPMMVRDDEGGIWFEDHYFCPLEIHVLAATADKAREAKSVWTFSAKEGGRVGIEALGSKSFIYCGSLSGPVASSTSYHLLKQNSPQWIVKDQDPGQCFVLQNYFDQSHEETRPSVFSRGFYAIRHQFRPYQSVLIRRGQ